MWKLTYPRVKKPVRKTVRRYRFKIGDTVRISHLRQPFNREYDERWTSEYFVVDTRGKKQNIAFYTLKDILEDDVEGTFYESELTEVKVTDDTTYRIETVIRRRGQNALVKWLGWPKKFNSWIPLTSLENYKNANE